MDLSSALGAMDRLHNEIKETCLISGRSIDEVKLIIVTKGHTLEEIAPIYAQGQRAFGENKMQEALPKIERMRDCEWHFIGNLQKNKVRKAIPNFSLIHSVDSVALAAKIDEVSEEQNKKTPILLQVNTANDVAKLGFDEKQIVRDFEALLSLKHVDVQGFMTIGAKAANEKEMRLAFAKLRLLKENMEVCFGRVFPHLSMGMSQDFKWAILEGATLLRIGSRIFTNSN